MGMTANEMKKKLLPVQLVLSPCRSPLEVIIKFDIDSCCVVFDPVKRVVQCLPRFRRALQMSVNVTDMAMRSPSYETRLEKYAQRGFAIGIPGFREEYVDIELFNAEYFHDPMTMLLFRLEARSPSAPSLTSTSSHKYLVRGKFVLSSKRIKVPYEAKLQRLARIVAGLERLLLFHFQNTPAPIWIHIV